MSGSQAAYDELYVYAMTRPKFIIQHVIDAYKAQTATNETAPIAVVFSLAGLYLKVEKGHSGTDVQRVHQLLAKRKQVWPRLHLPDTRGDMTAVDVLAVPPGVERDIAIDQWCNAVWRAFHEQRVAIISLLATYGVT